MGLSVGDVSGIGAVSNLIQDVADKIWPDPKERDNYMLQVKQLDVQLAAGQAAIDQQEASSTNLFVAGWRPFIGWTCGAAFAYHMILVPLVQYILALKGIQYTMPIFDDSLLSTTLMGMLGLGVLRTTEKRGDKGHLPWQQNTDN